MISIVGNYLLIFSIAVALATILFRTPKLFYLTNISLILSFCTLITGFIYADFSIKNIFFNSSANKPLLFKIAAGWASHEGSMLLWVSLFAIVSMIAVIMTRLPLRLKQIQIAGFASIEILFSSFIYFTSNPFTTFNFRPSDGLGLNPVLQDVALAIHPPVLYSGYVTYGILFINSIIIADVTQNKTVKEIGKDSTMVTLINYLLSINKKSSNFALAMISSGIGLGAWWAYRELGWGGFWFFDPVENISLLPWLSGIGLHHFLTIKNNHRYLLWILILSIVSFLLVIYGMCLVRSGIISSVHSFAFSPQRGLYIFFICLLLTGFSIKTLLKYKNPTSLFLPPQSKQGRIIVTGNILWVLTIISLLITIIYPLGYFAINQAEISIANSYYYKIFIPLFIPILFLAAIALYKKELRKPAGLFLLSIILTCIIHYQVKLALIAGTIILLAIFLILTIVNYFLVSSDYLNRNLTIKQTSLFLGHFGFGLLALSISLNSLLTSNIAFQGKPGEQKQSEDLTVRLNHINFADHPVYFRQIVEFSVTDRHNNMIILRPENRLYKTEQSLSQEADIFSFLTHDLYAVLNKIEDTTIHASIHYQPMMSFIWLAVFLIAVSFFLPLFARSP